MATLPFDPYAPDPVRAHDVTPMPDGQPEALPGPDKLTPPAIQPGGSGDTPSDTPTRTQA